MGQDKTSTLDQVRNRDGNRACISLLAEAAQTGKAKAAELLADRALTFPCLFILLPQIRAAGLEESLPPQAADAAAITRRISSAPAEKAPIPQNEHMHAALRWMVETGSGDPEPEGGYQKTMDIAVSLLIHTYGDLDLLPAVADMIFARRRRGHNVHDLIWAFFRSRDPKTLLLIAQRLPDAEPKEAEFIRDLLGIAEKPGTPSHLQYREYLQELEANSPSLQFNEENKQYMSRPVVCRLKSAAHGGERRV